MTKKFSSQYIEMAHGSGGRAMAQLIDEVFVNAFDNPLLNEKNDAALFTPPSGRMVVSTDCHVISPLFFPGGDIGSLAIHGTVNDLAMAGGEPLYITCGFILEEGFPIEDLQRIVQSMAQAATDANVQIITGDTKVVEKNKADGVFITTTGVGYVAESTSLSPRNIRVGDQVLINGSIGDHGISILSLRENLGFHTSLKSDCASLHTLVTTMLNKFNNDIHCLRDPTRGGVSATLNELAQQSQCGMKLYEDKLIIQQEVHAACELFGLDPLNIANEGKLIAFCSANNADALLDLMRAHPLGKQATIIGEVIDDSRHLVELQTQYGGTRIVDWLHGDQLPRIC